MPRSNARKRRARLIAFIALVISAIALLAVSGLASVFLRIDGIEGDSTSATHRGWIDVTSYGLSIAGPNAGGSASRPTFQDLYVTKGIDQASPMLYTATATGKRVGSARLEVCHTPGEREVCFLSYDLKDVLVTSVTTGVDDEGKPQEAITLDYGQIAWAYTPHDTAGATARPITGGYNVAEGQAQ